MITVACPICGTHCGLSGDAHPREPLACPDCGEVASVPYSPAVTAGMAWSMTTIAMIGIVTGFMAYLVTAKHIAPALKVSSGAQVAAQ